MTLCQCVIRSRRFDITYCHLQGSSWEFDPWTWVFTLPRNVEILLPNNAVSHPGRRELSFLNLKGVSLQQIPSMQPFIYWLCDYTSTVSFIPRYVGPLTTRILYLNEARHTPLIQILLCFTDNISSISNVYVSYGILRPNRGYRSTNVSVTYKKIVVCLEIDPNVFHLRLFQS